jgi:tetratricopeptide (TPR) repeat protein
MRNIMRGFLTGLVLMLAALPASGQSKRDEDENSNAISQETLEALTTDYFSRGNAYYDKGFYDQAIADYTKAIKFLPVNADVYFNLEYAFPNERAG